MLLSDTTVTALLAAQEVVIVPPPEPEQLQPISIDLRLGNSFCWLPEQHGEEHRRLLRDWVVVQPGEFLLATTVEHLTLPRHIAAFAHGKSTVARRGLMVEAAGLIDPGFQGTVTLELKNLSHLPLRLTAGMLICQVTFHVLDTAVTRPYGSPGLLSHYQGQTSAEPARG
jgi:dCTP deaminase